MPFAEPRPVDISTPWSPEPVPAAPPVFGIPLGAGLRLGSEIVSILSREDLGIDNRLEYGYDVFKDIEGTIYEQYMPYFIDVRNSRLAAARKRSIDKQLEDRRNLEAAGWGGVVAEAIGGLASPLTFVPGGALIRATRFGFSIPKSALNVGKAAGVALVPQEFLLQASQETRTPEEGFINVGAGVALALVLGGAGAWALGGAERAVAARGLRQLVGPPEVRTGAAEPGGIDAVPATPSIPEPPSVAAPRAEPEILAPQSLANRESPALRRITSESSIEEKTQGFQAFVDELRTMFGIKSNIRVEITDLGPGVRGHAEMRRPSNEPPGIPGKPPSLIGAAIIRLNSNIPNLGRFVEVLGHEFGHVAERTLFREASQIEREAIVEAWRRDVPEILAMTPEDFIRATKGPFLSEQEFEILRLKGPGADVDEKILHYRTKFNEWFADQTSKWIASNAVPQNIVDKFFAGVADMWRKVYAAATGRRPVAIEVEQFYRSRIKDPEIQGNVVPSSVGAAVPHPIPPRDDFEVSGRFARAVDTVTSKLFPVRRLARSASSAVRYYAAQLLDQAVNTAAQARGEVPTPLGTVERSFKVSYDSMMGKALTEIEGIFRDATKKGMTKNREEFQHSIAVALRNGDSSPTPAVEAAAKVWRSQVLDPISKELQELGLARISDEVVGALSYFPRVYRKHQLRAQEHRFKRLAQPEMEKIVKQAHDEDAAKTAERIARHNQDAEDMALPPEARAAKISALSQQIEYNEALEPHLTETVEHLDDLRKRQTAARKEGNHTLADQLKREAEEIRKNTDQLGPFSRELRELKRRRAKLERVGRKEVRVDKIRQQLVDIEEGMQKGLESFARKWQKFQREADNLTDDAVNAQIEKFQGMFDTLVRQGDAAMEKTLKNIEDLDKQVADANAAIEAATKGEQPNLQKIAEMQKAAGELEARVRPIRRRLLRLAEEQDKRAAALRRVAAQLDEAETDPGFAREQLDMAYREVLTAASNKALGRGERAAALQERLEAIDPDFLAKERARSLAKAEAAQHRFDQRWTDAMRGPDPFGNIARHAIDDLFTKIAGLQYVKDIQNPYLQVIERGPLKNRTNPLPDNVMEPWLENNAEGVMRHWARVMTGEIELAKFDARIGGDGDPNLSIMFSKINEDFDNISKAIDVAESAEEVNRLLGRKAKGKTLEAIKEDALDKLRADQKLAVDDLTAARDLLRGTYKIAENTGGWGRIARSMNAFNYVRLGGLFGLSSVGDLYRGAMAHGLNKYLTEGIGQLKSGLESVKLAINESHMAGLGWQNALHHKTMSMGEVLDPFARYTPAENLLQNAGQLMSRFNGINLVQDTGELANSLVYMNIILRNEGTPELYAHLNLNRDMLDRIQAHFRQHGDNTETTAVANTQLWTRNGETDTVAIESFRRAVAQAVHEVAVMPGLGEKPLFAYGPLGSMIMQFRAFNLGAHQRVLMRGLQGEPHRLVSGIVGMSSVGMLVSWLKAWSRGEERYKEWSDKVAASPLFWIAEGLDASGIFTLAFEAGRFGESVSTAMFGKAWNPMMTILTLGGAPIDSRQRTNVFESMSGPSIGLGADIPEAAGTLMRGAFGVNTTKSETRRAFGVLPGSSLPIFKDITQILNDDHPWM